MLISNWVIVEQMPSAFGDISFIIIEYKMIVFLRFKQRYILLYTLEDIFMVDNFMVDNFKVAKIWGFSRKIPKF